MEEKDAVIVGARCAGSTLAIALAERGWDVLLIDPARDPRHAALLPQVDPSRVLSKERLARWFSAEPEAASL